MYPVRIHGAVDKVFGWKLFPCDNHLEVVGSILTTGKNIYNNLNTCTQSWLAELEQSTPVGQIKGSFRDSVWTPAFH